ncbi:MAG: AraC family transcriptional regulator [Eubacteriales bacterium]|nr:AraC family transcriptional regulator [Eubacteriales bacterium]
MFQPITDNFVTDYRSVPISYKMKHFHEHQYNELLFIINGNCSLQMKTVNPSGQEETLLYKLTSGSAVIIPAQTPHMTIYLSGSQHTRGVIYFNNEELKWFENELGTEAAKRLVSNLILQIPEKKISYMKELIEKIGYERKGVDNMSLAFIRTYFHSMILFMLRCYTYKENVISKINIANRQIQDIIEYIIKNYSEDITLAGTSEFFHMSQSSLSRKFKMFTGKRFKEYLIDIRTEAAADALRNTSQSITEIASSCGFSDSNTFGDTFKRIYNMSPTEYRRCH